MKPFRLLSALGLALALATPSWAATHVVASLSTSAVSTILVVPNGAQWVTFTNMGAGAVNAVLDGGAGTVGGVVFTNTDPTTTSTGIAQIVIPAAANGAPGFVVLYIPTFFQGAVVRAIMQSGTTTLNVGVGMLNNAAVPSGTFPTN